MKFRFHKYGAAPVLSVTGFGLSEAGYANTGSQIDLSATPWQDAPALVLMAALTITQGFTSDAPQTGILTISYAFSQAPCPPDDAITILHGRANGLACQIKSGDGFRNLPGREFATDRLPITGRYLTLWYNGDGVVEDVLLNFDVHAIPCE